MKSVFRNARWKWLRLMLVVLLPLHTGFAQAAMVMPGPAAEVAAHVGQHPSAADAQLMPDGLPCHHLTESAPSPDHSSGHKVGCCDAGSCHCPATCGLSFMVARIRPQPALITSPFTYLSVPAAARPPDLRPPIF